MTRLTDDLVVPGVELVRRIIPAGRRTRPGHAIRGPRWVTVHADVNPTACPGKLFPWLWLREQLAPKPIPPIQGRVGLVFRGVPVEGGGYLIDSTSHVPVRFLAERLGARVTWRDGMVFVE